MTDPTTPTFAELNLEARLLSALEKLGFTSPTAIQAAAIPPLREGRDVIGRARTGSGKTAAYALPMLERINASTGHVRALILAPTRELALQVTSAIRELAQDLPVRVVTVYGGAPYPPQLSALSKGVPIVVGTPGRVLDHMDRGSLDLSKLELLVLDEADEMLRMGFIEAVETVVQACPPDRQIALLSATMPPDIQRIAKGHLRDPIALQLNDNGPDVAHIEQMWVRVPQRHKLEALQRLLMTGPDGATVVFVRTRKACAEIADALAEDGIAAEALHGDMAQAARERVVQRLRAGRLKVIIATEVAARGLDIDHVNRVVNFDIPDDLNAYVHRIGRTARAGREGEAITLVSASQRRRIGDYARKLGVTIRKVEVPSDDDILRYRLRQLREELQYADAHADIEGAKAWLRSISDDNAETMAEIGVAAVAHLAAMRGLDLRPLLREGGLRAAPDEEARPRPHTKVVATNPADDHRRRAAAPDSTRRDDDAEAPSDRGERAPRQEREPAPRDDSGGTKRPTRSARPDAPPEPDGAPVVLFLSMGARQGLRPGDIVGALVNQAGLPAEPIGRIVVEAHKAFVELPASLAEHLLRDFSTMELRNQEVRVVRAHPGSLPDFGPTKRRRGAPGPKRFKGRKRR